MRKIAFVFVGFLLLTPVLSASTPDEVADAIKTGDAGAISKHFSDNIDLKILDREDVYSKAQAELIIKDFFAKHSVKSFTLIHKSAPSKGDNTQYSIGSLETYNGKFRVYFLLKKNVFKVMVSQLRIEAENE